MSTLRLRDASVVAESGEDEITILKPTSLTITEPRTAIIGANGSGKSTLARLFNGLVQPSSGKVFVDDLDVSSAGRQVRQRVGFIFTNPGAQLVMPTAVEDVALSLRRTHRNRRERRAAALKTLATFGLAELSDRSVHTLSGGQKQLLAVAGVVASEPRVIIADEPTTLLDLGNTRTMADLLFGLEQQLLLVTHDLDLAERCDRALVISDGAVSFDGPATEAVSHYRQLAHGG